jgi:hypothetical protein
MAMLHNEATEKKRWMSREKEERTFAVYVVDISRDCSLLGIAIASPSKICLSIMRPCDPVVEKVAKYKRDTFGYRLPLFNYKCRHCAANRRFRARFLTANRLLSDFVNFGCRIESRTISHDCFKSRIKRVDLQKRGSIYSSLEIRRTFRLENLLG